MSLARWILLLAAIGVTTATPGCYNTNSQSDSSFKVVCTTGMVADLARNIGQDEIMVQQLMGAGVDPHLYTESLEDIGKLEGANLILYSGLHLEGQMGNTLERLAITRPTVEVTKDIDRKLLLKTGEGVYDPHVWFDVSLWSKAADAARDALVKADPKNAVKYNVRAEQYSEKLAALHAEVKAEIATIPKDQRVLVTAHDAFQYFGRAYDIEVKGIQGISTEAEASLKDIESLVQFITQRKVKAVFVESSVNKANVEALIAGCKAAGHEVKIGGELFSDAMGPAGTPEGTYIGMVRHNMRTIVDGLK